MGHSTAAGVEDRGMSQFAERDLFLNVFDVIEVQIADGQAIVVEIEAENEVTRVPDALKVGDLNAMQMIITLNAKLFQNRFIRQSNVVAD